MDIRTPKQAPLTAFQAHIIEREQRTNDGCCLFLTMGAGKTRVAIELIKKFKARRVLIVSLSKIVKDTWPNQIAGWDLQDYDYLCLANKPAKLQAKIMNDGIAPMTIVATNFESFGASVATKNRPKRIDLAHSPMLYAYETIPWDIIIIDESTCIKDPTSNTALAMINLAYNCGNAYVMCLTGTPNPEASVDFYTQITVVDRGKRFGESFTSWRNKYFYLPQYSRKWKPFPFGVGGKTIQEVISELCHDMCYVLTKEDFNKTSGLLPRNTFDIYFELNEVSKSYYKQMKENVIALPEADITAQNAAIVVNKLLQISSGIVYGNENEEGRKTYFFGLEKIQACIHLIKQILGKVIVCYNYIASLENLTLYLGLNDIEYVLEENTTETEFRDSKTVKVLLLQPRAGAYGANYQFDCHNMIWYEVTSSGEKFAQTCARIDRPGQKFACNFYYLIGRSTYDKVARDNVRNKEATALTALLAIKEYQKATQQVTTIKDKTKEGIEFYYIMEDMF